MAFYIWGIVAAEHYAGFGVGAALNLFLTFASSNYWKNADAYKLVVVTSLTFCAGVIAGNLALQRLHAVPYRSIGEHHVLLEVVALERPRVQDSATLRVRIVEVVSPHTPTALSLAGRVGLLTFPAETASGSLAGARLRVRCRVTIPGGSRNEGEPAERDTLADQGVEVVLAAHRIQDVQMLSAAAGWEAWWARARQSAASAIEARLPPLEATVLEGILWGDRGNLPASLRQEFSDTGTVHVLTTAGLHLGIMAGFLAALLLLLPLSRPARMTIVLTGAWLYAALAGMHLPTLRAATMLTAGTLAQELGRGRTTSAVLAAAACAVALPHPLVVISPSFAMSFACVVGIALLNPTLAALGLREGCGLPRFITEVLQTSLSVQIALWPLQALYFNAFTPYAVLANAIVVPMVGAIMAVGALFACAALILPILAAPLGNLEWWGLTLLISVVRHFATLPMAHIDLPPPSHCFLVSYWCGLAALAWFVQTGNLRKIGVKRIVQYAGASVMILAVIYCWPAITSRLDRNLYVDAIDVGQADCILIRAPHRHALLIDGGGKLERTTGGTVVAAPIGDRIAARTVMPFLLRHWVTHLDAVVLTHPHGDHVGGIPVILSRERVDKVYDSAQLYSGPAYRRTLDVIRDRHITWMRAQRGVEFPLGSTTRVQMLAPELPLITGTSSDINNNSVVLRITFGQVAILLTGDAQSEAEARLLSHGLADLRADILKVGHHGSAYSSTPQFLAAVHPKIAVISCGLHNIFGHPSPQTLATLKAAGARCFRTDLNGGVSVISDGASMQAKGAMK